jgi:Uma2 family endonuclease
MSVATKPAMTGRVVMYGVSWEDYAQLMTMMENRHARISYDRGTLEIMSPSSQHEKIKSLIVSMVDGIAAAFAMPVASFGSTTFKRDDLKKGIEADACFYVSLEPQMRERDDIDIAVDPPPELAVEVDVTRSVTHRLPIYAKLGIGEIWVWRTEKVRFLLLQDSGKFAESETSRAFPFLKAKTLAEFIAVRRTMNSTALVKALVQHLQERR